MTCGLQRNGTDLDAIFMARVNAKIADVNIKSNGGVDISNRFEAKGSATAVAATNIKTAGADLNTLFRDIAAPLVGVTAAQITADRVDGGTPGELYFKTDGHVWQRLGASLTDLGSWCPAGTSSQYAVMISILTNAMSSGPASGVWTTVSSDVVWTRGAAVGATQICTFNLSIRRVSDSVVLSGPTACRLSCQR